MISFPPLLRMIAFASSSQKETAMGTIFFSPNEVKLNLILKIWIFLESLRYMDTIQTSHKYLFKLCLIVMIPHDLVLKISLAIHRSWCSPIWQHFDWLRVYFDCLIPYNSILSIQRLSLSPMSLTWYQGS